MSAMRRVLIIGGETHIGEITALAGRCLEIVGGAVREEQLGAAGEQFACPVTTDWRQLLQDTPADLAAIANENDLKAEVILAALDAGLDVVVDKPLGTRLEDQEAIESQLAAHPERRLLNLLTLRGDPLWRGMHDLVAAGEVGTATFAHVRMAVQLKRHARPPWFLDSRRSGGLFLDC